MRDTIDIAREAGLEISHTPPFFIKAWEEELKVFESLVRADEREACAKVCEARYMGDNNREDMEAKRCAEAIRARNET